MPRTRRILVAALLAALAVSTPLSAARADAATGSASNLVFKAGSCQSTVVSASGLDPSGSWTVEALSPTGNALSGSGTVPAGGSAVSFSATLCPRAVNGVAPYARGLYDIVAVNALNKTSAVIGHFRVTYPRIRISRGTKARSKIGHLQLRGEKLTQKQLVVQGYFNHRWINVVRHRTDGDGNVHATCAHRGRCDFKVRFAYQNFAFSRAFRLR